MRRARREGPLGKDLARLFLAVTLFFLLSAHAEGSGESPLAGRIGIESGVFQPSQDGLHPYLYSYLELEAHPEVTEGFSLDLEGRAEGWASGVDLPPFEPGPSRNNAVDLQWKSDDPGNPFEAFQLGLDQADLHWASGPWDLKAGLFKPDWGSAFFYRPTDYFFPVPPLAWLRDTPAASEGADASCFLFDDLSLEGAVRSLEGGQAEGVLRLADKGIGLTVTPSVAWLEGRDGLGLEMVGTFPTFQVRLEGVDWLFPDGRTAPEWDLGISTSHDGIQYVAEVLRDGTGEVLGDASEGKPGTYVFLKAEARFQKRWKVAPALVAPLEGGPLLFWPQVTCNFAPQWEAGFQAQVLLGNWEGALRDLPGRAGLSITYSF